MTTTIDVHVRDYFENKWIQLVARWCMSYYNKHGKAPVNHINDLFNARKRKLKEDEADLIEDLLNDAATEYQNKSKFNVDYMSEQALGYFKNRHLALLRDNITSYLEDDKPEKAEVEVANFRNISKKLSTWSNPFDIPSARGLLLRQDENFFTLPGLLGEFLGNFKRGWLVGIAAPFKRGKTWFAQEFALMALLSGLKVAFFSLEMSSEEMQERILKRLIPGFMSNGNYLYPVLDCLHNQTGNCESKRRKNTLTIIDEEENIMEHQTATELGYQICTFCRHRGNLHPNFEPAIWHEEINTEKTVKSLMRSVASFEKKYASRFKLKTYPKFSANIHDIQQELDNLEAIEGFIPDMIVIDHADCLKPERADLKGIEKEDETWMTAAQLASKRRALTIVPTQVTKDALTAAMTTQKHTAKWVGKLGHVDAMLAMSQTDAEKRRDIIRVSIMLHRHRKFDENAFVTLIQKLDSGQFHLDSEFNRVHIH